MADTLNLAFSVALIATLWATAVGSGLSHRPGEVVAAAADGHRFARLIAIDAIAIPLVVYALARLLSVPEGFTAGLVLVGAASAGAIGLAVARLADGDIPLAIGLVIVLEAGNLITIPVWSTILLPEQVRPPVAEVVGTLVIGILVPYLIGSGLRGLWPERAHGWAGALAVISAVGFAVAVGIVVWIDLGKFVDAWVAFVPIVALATTVAALGAGWVAGGPLRPSRATGAVIVAMRANAPALAVTSATFGATSDAAAAIVVFALVSYIAAPVFAIWAR